MKNRLTSSKKLTVVFTFLLLITAITNLPASAVGLKTYVAGEITEEDVRKYRDPLHLERHGIIPIDQNGELLVGNTINYEHATAICEAKFPDLGTTWGKPKVKTEPLRDWWHDIRLSNGENNWQCWDSYWSWL